MAKTLKLTCTTCGAKKPEELFPADSRNTKNHGRGTRCRACCVVASAASVAKRKAKESQR